MYQRGDGLDIHKAIGKLPLPKAGYTPGRYKSIGWFKRTMQYNLLGAQLEYNKDTGEITKWHVQPYNKVGKVAAPAAWCWLFDL